MPTPSDVVITIDGEDVTPYVLFSTASFEAQVNAIPGTFEISLKDPDQSLEFVTGKEITLDIDGQRMYGGFVTQVARKFFFPAVDTSDAVGGPAAVKTRMWVLRGVDYNVLFDKRVLRNPDNFLSQIPNFNGGRKDGDLIRNDLTASYLDLATDGLDTTTEVDDVICPFSVTDDPLDAQCDPTKVGAWMQQGSTWRKQMEDFAQFSGSIWYINPDKQLVWKALETFEARWGFSDVPNKDTVVGAEGTFMGSTYGFRELDATEDGSFFVNDALIWGGSEFAGASGGTVFARKESATSQADHGRWQYAETHFGEEGYRILDGVEVRAAVIVNGQPGSVGGDTTRGLNHEQWQLKLSWYAHDVPLVSSVRDHLKPGNIVYIELQTFGIEGPTVQILPIRQFRISFPTLNPDGDSFVRFDGTFALQLDDPYTLWRYLLKQRSLAGRAGAVSSADNTDTDVVYGTQYRDAPLETPDGIITVFSIPFAYIAGMLHVFRNGIQGIPGVDFDELDPNAGTFEFTTAPLATDTIQVITVLTGAPA